MSVYGEIAGATGKVSVSVSVPLLLQSQLCGELCGHFIRVKLFIVNRAINRSTSRGTTPDFATYREGLGKELWSWIMNPKVFRTVVVEGPRGSGKSTLAHMTLSLSTSTQTNLFHLQFAQSILDVLNVPPPENQIKSALNRVEEALAASKKDKRVPIIHVEVDVRGDAKQLQNLLILLKVWGEDLKLVRAVVTLSSSRAALGLSIAMDELRADIFEIEDYTDEEAKQYMRSSIRSLVECKDEEFKRYCSNLLGRLGRRPLHLKHLYEKLLMSMGGKSKISLETLEKNTNTHMKRFTKQFRDKIGDKEKFYNFFKRLQEKPRTLFETGKMLGIEPDYFIKLVSEFTPHPFYIKMDEMVHLNTEIERSIDKKALEEALDEDEDKEKEEE